jgi:hypothetical protein
LINWEEYIGAPAAQMHSRQCRALCNGSFEPVRDLVTRVIGGLAPRSIACLGAGVLNDIPLRDLVREAVDLHLVDWIPGVIETGIAQSIVEHDPAGRPECAFCALGEPDARTFCRRFAHPRDGVCDSFEESGGAPPTCAAYERGDWPRVLRQDVTGGYASAFARVSMEATRNAETWRQALKHATTATKTARRHRSALDIADGSIDLVTSSMVMSQFDHEPYEYFSSQLAARLGPPSDREERRLAGALEILRSELVARQIEGHLDEIARIMARDGRFLAVFELFHRRASDGSWFLVRPMHAALEMLDERFDFDFGLLAPDESTMQLQLGGEPSVVQAFVLRHKDGHAA